jgi:Ca2+-transporting ATPase
LVAQNPPHVSDVETVPLRSGQDGAAPWHALTVDEACARLDVDPGSGLDAAEVERRRAEHGANRLAEAEKEPGWHAFLRQYRDLMQLVLLGAAIVSVAALQEVSTGILIAALTVLNAVLGLNQEGKAAESVAALQKMLLIRAHARRGGELVDIPAEELVPGDIVSFEAGDKIPADGRLLVAATLEIEEAALTGESAPVLKSVEPVSGGEVALGDRLDMAYMNSTVTRGRGEMVVTATGMATEVGEISGMLSQVQQEKTPLTRQLDQLTVVITIMAAIALALVVIIGLLRGDDFDELFVIGISLAISAIPTGLPAVVTTMLSLGTQALAAKGAIVKRLRSVETLGSTSAICSDRHADPQPDDRARAGRRGPPVRGRGGGLLDRRPDPARRRRDGHGARPLPAAHGARERRGRPRGRDRG